MARQEKYTQCRLSRPLKKDRRRAFDAVIQYALDGLGASEVLVSWIPADIAKKGAKVRLKEIGPDEWSEGWTVNEVWGTRSGDYVEAAVPDWRHQRAQSDV